MKIEKEEILFLESRIVAKPLNDLQKNYLQILMQERTIEKTFLYYLRQGWLINFHEFYNLIKTLLEQKSIRNLNFYHAFAEDQKVVSSNDFHENESQSSSSIDLSEKVFFKSLPEEVLALFKKNSRVIEVPERSILIREGTLTRDMYLNIEGQLAVFKSREGKKVRIADLNAGSVFGEAGFLWNTPRSADIVSLSRCQLLRFQYSESDFSSSIQTQMAEKSQVRFWALHAFMQSSLLRDLPSDHMNELIQSGRKVTLKPKQVLCTEGDSGTSFYILIQGHLQVLQRSRLIRQLTQGDLLGEISLFVSAGRRTATIQSLNDCVLLEIEKDEFYRILSRNLFLAREIEALAWERIHSDQKRAVVSR